MSFFEEWVELDLNPIISFSSSSKILYSNSEAQFLLSRIKQKELFELALQYAPKTYGVETSYIDLSLQNYTFYAITVKYENDEEIHMKLYKSAMVKKTSKLNMQNIDTTNIFSLVDLVITTNKIKSDINFIKNYDPSIPDFRIDSSLFIKTISQAFEAFETTDSITVSVMLKIGEYIRIEGKKYSLISVEISSQSLANLENIHEKEESSFILSCDKNKITIDLPLII